MASQDQSVVLPASTSSPSFRLLPTPTTLQAGERQLQLSSPVCMGVLNITPDSFSDGSELARSDRSELDLIATRCFLRLRRWYGMVL